MSYRGMMDGWHGDEPHVQAVNELNRRLMDDYLSDVWKLNNKPLVPMEDDDRRERG